MLLVASTGASLRGQEWQRLGPEGGMVLSLGLASSGTLYLGTNDGHIFQSVDRGGHWELRGRVGTRTDAVIAQLAVDPRKPQRVFAAVWFREAGAGGGVYCSDDNGRTWFASGLQGESTRALEFVPSQPQTLIAGTRSGVFRSRDGGQNWERISPLDDPELRNVDSIAIDPTDPGIIYAGTYHLPWKTTDGGKSWKAVGAGLIDDSDIMSMRVDGSNTSRLYLSACSGIYRSDDAGSVWAKLQGIPYSARRTQAIVQDRQNPGTLYAGTTEGLWITRDSGESWERATPKDRVVNTIVVLPPEANVPARVIIGTQGQGVLVSDDAGKTFADANRGFTHPVVKQLVAETRHPRHLLLLSERNGIEIEESWDAGKNWTELIAAPASGPKSSGWNPDRIEKAFDSPWGWMAQQSDGSLWLYQADGKTWLPWKLFSVPQGKLALQSKSGAKSIPHPSIPSAEVLGFSVENAFVYFHEALLRCDRSGKCGALPAFAHEATASALWVSGDGQVLALASEGKLGISHDAGKTAVWRDLPADGSQVSWILLDSPAAASLWLGTRSGLYLSSNEGEKWRQAGSGLPVAATDHGIRGKDLFGVTLVQGGIYVSRDGGVSWVRIDKDAQHGRITGVVETQPGRIVLGSQSEGVLQWDSAEQK